ncbi:hypothetical protein Hdeb2414_s0006g00215651 [Helianthus debilis subsp. tardiflorus]
MFSVQVNARQNKSTVQSKSDLDSVKDGKLSGQRQSTQRPDI